MEKKVREKYRQYMYSPPPDSVKIYIYRLN